MATSVVPTAFPMGSNLSAAANEFVPVEGKVDEMRLDAHRKSSDTEGDFPVLDSPSSIDSLDSIYNPEEIDRRWLQPDGPKFMKPLTPSSCSTSNGIFHKGEWAFSNEHAAKQHYFSRIAAPTKRSERVVREFVILRGLPGTGKSTVSERLGFDAGSQRISPVMCSVENYLPGDRSQHEPAFIRDAHAQCRADFFNALRARSPLIVLDGVHERRWHYQMYVDFARSAGYNVRVVELRPHSSEDLWKCWHRNVHGYDKQAFLALCRDWEADRSAEVLLVRFR